MTQDTISSQAFKYTEYFTPESSLIEVILFDEETDAIGVIFVGNNEVYTYDQNYRADYEAFVNAPSAGQFYNYDLNRTFTGRRYDWAEPRPLNPTSDEFDVRIDALEDLLNVPGGSRPVRFVVEIEDIATQRLAEMVAEDITKTLAERYPFFVINYYSLDDE